MKKNNEFQLIVYAESEDNNGKYLDVLTYFCTENYDDAFKSMIDFIKGEQSEQVSKYIIAEFDKENNLINQWNFSKDGIVINNN